MRFGGVLLSIVLSGFIGSQSLALEFDGTVWNVVSKKCGDVAVALNGEESYHLPQSKLAHVYVASDTAELQCKKADAFGRLAQAIQSSVSATNVYLEKSVLIRSAVRTVCRNKVNGVPVNPVVSDDIAYDQNSKNIRGFEISADLTAKTASARITKSPECAANILTLELKLKE